MVKNKLFGTVAMLQITPTAALHSPPHLPLPNSETVFFTISISRLLFKLKPTVSNGLSTRVSPFTLFNSLPSFTAAFSQLRSFLGSALQIPVRWPLPETSPQTTL